MASESVSPPTMADVARVAGVSASTVSRVLSSSPRISTATAARVRAAIDQLGYRATPAFAALGHRRQERRPREVAIAIVEAGTASIPAAVAERLNAVLTPRGYRVDPVRRETLGPRPGRALSWRGYGGVVLASPAASTRWEIEDWSTLAVIAFRPVGPIPFHSVRHAYNAGAQLAVRRAYELGYRRIGLAPMRHDPPDLDDHDRLGGALSEHCLLTGHMPAVPPLLASVHDRHAVVPWFKRHRPDVILGFTDLLRWDLANAGYRSPDDFAFLALSQSHFGEPVAGLCVDHRKAAEVLAEMLHRKICGSLLGASPFPCETTVAMQWAEGPSLPPREGRATTPIGRAGALASPRDRPLRPARGRG